MKRMPVVLLGLGLGFAPNALAEEGAAPAPAATSGSPAEMPRGVCTFTGLGISVVIEETTNEACRERQLQCEHDNPGRETECRSRWVLAERKAKAVKKANGKNGAAKSATAETPAAPDTAASAGE